MPAAQPGAGRLHSMESTAGPFTSKVTTTGPSGFARHQCRRPIGDHCQSPSRGARRIGTPNSPRFGTMRPGASGVCFMSHRPKPRLAVQPAQAMVVQNRVCWRTRWRVLGVVPRCLRVSPSAPAAGGGSPWPVLRVVQPASLTSPSVPGAARCAPHRATPRSPTPQLHRLQRRAAPQMSCSRPGTIRHETRIAGK
jgi:hypothetical protein